MANVCRKHVRAHVLGDPRAVGHRLDDVLGPPRLDRERLLQGEVVLQQGPHAVGHRHDADLGLLAVGAALALDPELALLPEDVLGGEVAQLADAEAGVEQGPDDEPLGGRLAGVGQAVGLVGGEGFSHVLIRHLPPPKSCVLGVGPRSRCAFRPPGYPHRTGGGSGSRPGKQGGSPPRAVSRAGRRGA